MSDTRISFQPLLVRELCAKYKVSVPEFTRDRNKKMRFDGLPNLSFLIELAQVHGISPDALKVDHDQPYDYCETCGPGQCTFTVTT